MKRFRRTKDEIERGLSPAQAKAERDAFQAFTAADAQNEAVPLTKKEINKIIRRVTGEIIVRIRPAKGVDSDYFEHLDGKVIVLEEDEHFYKWLDHLLDKVYNEHGPAKLVQDILDQGIGGVITTRQFTKDIK